MMNSVTVIGAGLAGSECAWQLARRGIHVRLIEMKPEKYTPAHKSEYFAELVCSNSLRGDDLSNAVGLLKEEMRRLGSLIMESAEKHRVAAGGALAVDREGFARYITEKLEAEPNIEIVRAEATDIPDGEVVIATGPLTSDAMAERIKSLCPEFDLHFYDAVAPIVTLESVDMTSAYRASRYGKGTADYINCPMTREEYISFVAELRGAKEAPVHGFDDGAVFEGCMPVEVMARRGEDTLRYGPMKPVGLVNPNTGAEDYAVVQLRQDNADFRLTERGYQAGLATRERYERMLRRREELERARALIQERRLDVPLRKPEATFAQIAAQAPEVSPETGRQLEIEIKYEGSIDRQMADVRRFRRLESMPLPADADYLRMDGLRLEAREKLSRVRPKNLGQAARIPGVNPSDIAVLSVELAARRARDGKGRN